MSCVLRLRVSSIAIQLQGGGGRRMTFAGRDVALGVGRGSCGQPVGEPCGQATFGTCRIAPYLPVPGSHLTCSRSLLLKFILSHKMRSALRRRRGWSCSQLSPFPTCRSGQRCRRRRRQRCVSLRPPAIAVRAIEVPFERLGLSPLRALAPALHEGKRPIIAPRPQVAPESDSGGAYECERHYEGRTDEKARRMEEGVIAAPLARLGCHHLDGGHRLRLREGYSRVDAA